MRAPVFLLLALLVAGGGVNYRRNAHLDAELMVRPHATLTQDELSKLLVAYETELERTERAVGVAPDPTERLTGLSASDIDARVRAFEEFQKDAEAWKERRRDVLDNRVMLDSLQREHEVRAEGLDQEWRRILRRVITIEL